MSEYLFTLGGVIAELRGERDAIKATISESVEHGASRPEIAERLDTAAAVHGVGVDFWHDPRDGLHD